MKIKPTGIRIHQQYKNYVEFADFNEMYEVDFPIMSAHNFIIGEMYVDIGDTMTITKLNSDMQATIDFTRRGWGNKEICRL